MARILVADDSSIIREPIAAALDLAGHATVMAKDGREALAILRSQKPDLLVLDLSMPVMDGFAVLEEMARSPFTRPAIIVMTDSADRATIERAAKMGVRNYLCKASFSMETLLERVRTALEIVHKAKVSKTPRTLSPRQSHRAAGSLGPASAGVRDEARQAEGQPHFRDVSHLKPIVSRSDLEQRLSDYATLQAFPPAVGEVVRLCKQKGATADHIARAIRNDPAIAVKVLRLANSVAYATGSPVFSVEQAVVRVGVATIGQAVLNIGVVDHFAARTDHNGIDSRAFWEHSIGCGLIAARLATAVGCMPPDAAFTMGLVHDIGRLMIAGAMGEEYVSVLAASKELGIAVEQVERRMLLTTHAECMNKTLTSWGFPRDFVDPVSLHHCDLDEIRAKAPKRWKETTVLALANRLSHALLPGTSINDTIYATREMCSALGLSGTTLADIQRDVPDETTNLKLSMLASGTGHSSGQATPLELWRWPDGVRPLLASSSPELDACALSLLKRVKTITKPNVGIMLVTDQADCDTVTPLYLKQELAAGVKDLPLLMITPGAVIQPGEAFIAGRAWRSASLPTPAGALLQCLKSLLAAGEQNVPVAA